MSRIIKICFFGPESTGKSVMAKRFAEFYQTSFVPEVAKEFISSSQFTVADIIRVGHAQAHRIEKMMLNAHRFLFCDTDFITTQIYSNHYLKIIPSVLFDLEKQIKFNQYFLFDIDVPWVADKWRTLGEKRQEIFALFKQELLNRKIDFILVTGSYEQRETIIHSALQQIK